MQKMDIVSARCAEPKAVLTVLANTPLDQSFFMYLLSLGMLPMMYLFGLPLEKLPPSRLKPSLLGVTGYGNG